MLHGSRDSFLQDLGSAQGTFLNGKRLKVPPAACCSAPHPFLMKRGCLIFMSLMLMPSSLTV